VREVFELEPARMPPDREAALRRQGVPAGVHVAERLYRIADQARELYASLAQPRGVYAELSRPAFFALYRGEGRNDPRTPLEQVAPRAERLALFAVTLGQGLSDEIDALFARNEPALAHALDAIASERADRAATFAAERFLGRLAGRGIAGPSARGLPYSPGYCGWHVSGQRRLFAYLRPEEIGVTLNESCLMRPLKSVSGVLVIGSAAAHTFDNDFDFCNRCATHSCRERIAGLVVDGGPRA
jgi:hypothetical protein